MKRLTALLLTLAIISAFFVTAYAAYDPIAAVVTRIAKIPNRETGTSAMGGISVAVTGSNKRLFVIKANDNNDTATLTMYLDYEDMNYGENEDFGYFKLDGIVGHANGMAIDDDYLYITCWQTNDTNGRKIARIKRSVLWSMYRTASGEKNKGTLTATSEGVTILPVEFSDGTEYNNTIKSITYYKNGQFLIGFQQKQSYFENNPNFTNIDTNTYKYITYTTAYVSDTDTPKFLLNKSDTDIFHIAVENKSAVGQDIGYHENCGFFVVRWDYDQNSQINVDNEIIWIRLNSLTGANRIYTPDNSKYRIINVSGGSDYNKFELESVSFGSDKTMFASVNCASSNNTYNTDEVIKIKRPTGVGTNGNIFNFEGATFTQN